MVGHSYKLVTPAGPKPLTLAEVKAHCRIDHADENDLLMGLIDAATKYAEDYQWSQLCTATWELRMNRFPSRYIELHPNPVNDIVFVKYYDTGGTLQTLVENTDYVLDLERKPGLVRPAYNESWPTARGYDDDVIVQFIAGYGEPYQIPQNIRQAMLMMINYWYLDRIGQCGGSGAGPFASKALLDLNSFRVFY